MPPDKEKAPPGGSGAPSKFIAAVNSEGPNNTVDLPVSQLLPRDVRPDEIPELRAPGQIAAEVVADLRRQRKVLRLHRLGPRATAELLAELGAERSITTIIDQKLERYAQLEPETLAVTGGDEFWPAPIREV